MSILPTASQSARLLRVESLSFSPGQCAVSGKGSSEKGFVDTGLDYDEWGRIYLEHDVVVEMANLFGMVSADKVREVEAENQDLATALIEAQSKIAELTGVIHALRTLDSSSPAIGAADHPDSLFGIKLAPETLERWLSIGNVPGASAGKSDAGNPTSESSSIEGSSNVSNITDKLDFERFS